MKKILITGAGSYIGTSFEEYMKQWPEDYQVDTLDMIGDAWKNYDFSGYDTVYHVAGIAHLRLLLQHLATALSSLKSLKEMESLMVKRSLTNTCCLWQNLKSQNVSCQGFTTY